MVAGVEVADLGGAARVVVVDYLGTARFVDCTFADNTARGDEDSSGGVVVAAGNAQVWLQGCQFVNNTAEHELGAGKKGTIYSDGPEKYDTVLAEFKVQPQKAPPDSEKDRFLGLPDDFVTDAAAVRFRLLALCQL